MYEIKSYYQSFNAEDILNKIMFVEEDYRDCWDDDNAELEDSCYTEEEATYLWNVLDYCMTDFYSDFGVDGSKIVVVKMYRLYHDGDLIEESTGYIEIDDIYDWFPSLAECDECHIDNVED